MAKRKRRSAKRRTNYMGAGAMVNRRRRRTKGYRRNPVLSGMSVMGVQLPSIERIALAGAGALAPEIVELLVEEFAPEFVATEGGQTAVGIGSYFVAPAIAYMLLGKRAAGDVLLGEAINLAMVGGRKLLGAVMESSPAAPAVSGYLGAGRQISQVAGYVGPRMRGYHTTPDRLVSRYPGRNYR